MKFLTIAALLALVAFVAAHPHHKAHVQHDSDDLEEEASVRKMAKIDTAALEEQVESSAANDRDKQATLDHIAHIKKNQKAMLHADKGAAERLAQANHLRVTAIQSILAASKPSFEEEEESAEEEKDQSFEEEEEEEDEDEAVAAAVAKKKKMAKANTIASDIESVRAAVKSAHLSKSARKEVEANLATMEKDAKKYAETGNKRFAKALNLRLEELHMQLGDKTQASLEEEEKESKVAKANTVASDIESVRAAMKSAHLSKSARKEVEANLATMEKDAKKYAETGNQKFAKALNLRTQALHKQLSESDQSLEEEEAPKHAKSDIVALVKKDVEQFQAALAKSHLPSKTLKQARKNVDAILADAERLASSETSPQAHSKLTKAIKLRIKALHEQMA